MYIMYVHFVNIGIQMYGQWIHVSSFLIILTIYLFKIMILSQVAILQFTYVTA